MTPRLTRCSWDLIRDILSIVNKGNGDIKKTRIIHGAYLDYNSFTRYFGTLIEKGFILKDEKTECYSITRKGKNLLDKLFFIKQTIPEEVRHEYLQGQDTDKKHR